MTASPVAIAATFAREVTSHGTPVSWRSSCVFITADSRGNKDMPANSVFSEIQAAGQNWSTAAHTCTYMQFMSDPPSSGNRARADGVNLIIWLEAEDRATHKYRQYDPNSPAQTTLTYIDQPGSASDGQLIDADTELNDIDYTWAAVMPGMVCPPSGNLMDVQNTLTHELGHMLGLGHNCNDGRSNPVDNDGQPLPPCPGSGPLIDATLYYMEDCAETKKRTPEAQDVAGMCTIYPLVGAQPPLCRRVLAPQDVTGVMGCQTTGAGRSETALPAWLLAVAVLALARRRAGRARP